MRNLMGSALGGADFEWSKTGDLRTEFMENDNNEDDHHDKLGNDLDSVNIDPQFQV